MTLKNKSFVLLAIMYTLVETNLHSTAIIIEILIKPFGFTKDHAVKLLIKLFFLIRA